LQAVIWCRYEVLAKYAQSLKRIYIEEFGGPRRHSPHEARALQIVEPSLEYDDKNSA
jgi:hypothetical protein